MSTQEVNIFQIGEGTPHYSMMNKGDFVFQKKTTTNMDKLWRIIYSSQDYPQFYIGSVPKMAACVCPETGKQEWHNPAKIDTAEPFITGTEIIVHATIKNKQYSKKTIFQKWDNTIFHEWKLESGNVLQLRQDFVDGLSSDDKRKLGMTK